MESAFGRAALMYGIMIFISFFVAALISLMTQLLSVMKKADTSEAPAQPTADGSAL